MVVQFDKKVLRPENVSIIGGTLFCFFNVVCLNRAVDFPRETSAQSNQTGGPLCEQLFIDSRGVMKAIQMRCGDKLDEVSVAGLVLGQQSDVICRVAPRCRPILVRPGSNVGFATNDRFHPGVMRFLVKFNRPKQIAVIRDRYGRHFEFSGLFHQLFHPDTSIQQRVFSMQMKVNERVSSHQFSSISVQKKSLANLPGITARTKRGTSEDLLHCPAVFASLLAQGERIKARGSSLLRTVVSSEPSPSPDRARVSVARARHSVRVPSSACRGLPSLPGSVLRST